MAHDYVCAGIDRALGDLAFIHADGGRRVPQSLMQRDRKNLDFRTQRLDIRNHGVQRPRFRKRVYRGWTSWRCMIEFIVRENLNVGAARVSPLLPKIREGRRSYNSESRGAGLAAQSPPASVLVPDLCLHRW